MEAGEVSLKANARKILKRAKAGWTIWTRVISDISRRTSLFDDALLLTLNFPLIAIFTLIFYRTYAYNLLGKFLKKKSRFPRSREFSHQLIYANQCVNTVSFG